MPNCPFCRRQISELRGSCPHCAKSLESDRRSSRPPAISMELPDLDLGPLTPAPPIALPKPAPISSASSTSHMAAVSVDFDPFDGEETDGLESLQLETVDEVLDRRAPASGPRLPAAPASNAASPPRSVSGVSRTESPPFELDPFEVLALADYGPIPTKLWETPRYALRVLLRRRQLGSDARRLQEELKMREKAWSDSLLLLVEGARPALEAHPDGGRWLAPIVEIESWARARGDALESVSSEFSAKVAEVDREIATAEEACQAEVTKLEPIAEELERRSSEHARAEAMLKRIDIEIRAAQQAARAAAGPDATIAPKEHAEKLTALAVEREARVGELARKKSDLDEVRRPYNAQERTIADRRRHVAELRKSRKALEEAYGRQLSVRSEGVAEAEREKRETAVEIGKRLLTESPVEIQASARGSVETAHQAFDRVREDLEKHQRAMEGFERGQFKRGLTILGAGIALFLTLVLWLFLRGGAEPI